ncbi:hypothetical protein BDR04DRAFT_167237 [Suillus decipiens]|nr:hypothetical protein BDR04DRAFT_167237 [Suillus decipiens]
MSNNGNSSGLPTPNTQWAQPQLQGTGGQPPFSSQQGLYYQPPQPQAQAHTQLPDFYAQPPPPHIPQLWPAYGQQSPAPNYYGGYPGPQGYGAPHYSQMNAPPAAPQAYAPPVQVPPPSVPFAGPQYHQQQYEQAVPMVPSAGPAEGSFTRGSKRKAVGDAETPQQKRKRHRPQGDPDFELVQPGPDGKQRWKCLKLACAHVNPMLEVSIHKHVTATRSHQQDSAVPQAEYVCPACTHPFKRKDALSRHKSTGQCIKNREKLRLEGTQANVQVAGTSTIAAVPSFSGSAASSETQQCQLLPVATPGIVQAAGSSTFNAAAPVAMHHQQQFTFSAQPGPSSAIQHSGVQATQTGGTWMIPGTSYAPQEVLSFPMQPNVQNEETSIQQQPAATPPLFATEADFSTTDQTYAPLPSPLPSSSNALPFVAGDFSSSIFQRAARSLTPSPSEDIDDLFGDLFSAPASPGASRVTPEPLHVQPSLNETAAEPTFFLSEDLHFPSEDVDNSFGDLFSASSSPTSPEVTPAPQLVEAPSSNAIGYDFLLSALNEPAAEPTHSLFEDLNSLFEDAQDSTSWDSFSAPPSLTASEKETYSCYLYSNPPSPS